MGQPSGGAAPGNGYSFSSQQFYSYKDDGKGAPEEYQAISQVAAGPNGVKETKKGYKDSKAQTQKMQYGRHIGDRATIQERSQVRGNREERTDYVGFDESNRSQFDTEWGQKAGGLYSPSIGTGLDQAPKRNREQGALPAPR